MNKQTSTKRVSVTFIKVEESKKYTRKDKKSGKELPTFYHRITLLEVGSNPPSYFNLITSPLMPSLDGENEYFTGSKLETLLNVTGKLQDVQDEFGGQTLVKTKDVIRLVNLLKESEFDIEVEEVEGGFPKVLSMTAPEVSTPTPKRKQTVPARESKVEQASKPATFNRNRKF